MIYLSKRIKDKTKIMYQLSPLRTYLRIRKRNLILTKIKIKFEKLDKMTASFSVNVPKSNYKKQSDLSWRNQLAVASDLLQLLLNFNF